MSETVYICDFPACSLGIPGEPGRFTQGMSAQGKSLLSGEPLELVEDLGDFGEGYCPNCGTKGRKAKKGGLVAFIFTDAGLDFLLGQYPKGATQVTTSYLELFTSQTASTVILHGDNTNTITETAYTSYARQAMAAATWGATSEYSTTLGRQTVYPQITFPTVGASGATINGFMIASTNAAPTATNIVCQANFDDVTAVVLATNDVIKVTPTMVFLH